MAQKDGLLAKARFSYTSTVLWMKPVLWDGRATKFFSPLRIPLIAP